MRGLGKHEVASDAFENLLVNKSSRTRVLLKQTRFIGTWELFREVAQLSKCRLRSFGKPALALSSASPHAGTDVEHPKVLELALTCLTANAPPLLVPLIFSQVFAEFLRNHPPF